MDMLQRVLVAWMFTYQNKERHLQDHSLYKERMCGILFQMLLEIHQI